MFESHEINAQNGQTNASECISEEDRPILQKSKRKRNDNPVSRFYALLAQGKQSRKAADDAFCAHCMGCTAKEQGPNYEDWIEPGFRALIRDCTTTGCPKWVFRPYQRGAK